MMSTAPSVAFEPSTLSLAPPPRAPVLSLIAPVPASYDWAADEARIVGRDEEQRAIASFLEQRAPAGALLIEGGAGIGKTTFWRWGVERAAELGRQVLTARPAAAEARLGQRHLLAPRLKSAPENCQGPCSHSGARWLPRFTPGVLRSGTRPRRSRRLRARGLRTAPAPRHLAAADLFSLHVGHVQFANALPRIVKGDANGCAFAIHDLIARDISTSRRWIAVQGYTASRRRCRLLRAPQFQIYYRPNGNPAEGHGQPSDLKQFATVALRGHLPHFPSGWFVTLRDHAVVSVEQNSGVKSSGRADRQTFACVWSRSTRLFVSK